MEELQLNEGFQTVLDASGNGAILVGPSYSYQTWVPTMINVQVSSNAKEPTFKFFRGKTVGQTNYIGGTFTGSNDTSDINGEVLRPGDTWLCTWTGGDAGASASVTLSGTVRIP